MYRAVLAALSFSATIIYATGDDGTGKLGGLDFVGPLH